ncbi:peptidoglycan DD-metalloendopeptidase family protein [Pseudalkalibacillus sp. R45]|uniref:peptidoglycan DD-metalloendopeptidase family protein n=1 Tax=Pseudalkalibacillus sp. R45 TaxID=3457433 RepID=UPI003FCCE3A4
MREEEKQKNPLKAKWYKKKRWVYPAVYLGFAAVILASVLWYQNSIGDNLNDEADPIGFEDQDSVPVMSDSEVLKSPVSDGVTVQRKFYDSKASEAEQEAALVFYNNTYFQNKGINYATESGEPFDVMASLSGKVVDAGQDPLVGYFVHIEHDNGVTTHYSSLENLQVEKGDTVKQGDVLGTAGMSLLDKEAQVHAHFEVRKDGVAVNPEEYFSKTVTDIPAQKQEVNETLTDEETDADAKEEADVDSDEENANPSSETQNDDAQPQENSVEDEDQSGA